ncbi:putative transcriptional regulator domain protein [Acinetobacter baumannii 15827]|nr:putative transcriptional regulator domain protein [Acinetobacter baumannii 15827]
MRCAKHSLYRLCCAFFSPKKVSYLYIQQKFITVKLCQI